MAIIRFKEGAVPAPFWGRAVFWYDGDTVYVVGGPVRACVRLFGIDAPEWGQSGAGNARAGLQGLTKGVPVEVCPKGFDRYGRIVATLRTRAVADVGLCLLNFGLVWWEHRFAREASTYRDAQAAARAAHVGLWEGSSWGFAPWVFRRRRRVGV